MTEKRFIFFAEKTGQHYEILIRDRIGEEYIITDDFFRSKDVVWEIKDLLNVMNDILLEQAKQVSKLSEENEQLRQSLDHMITKATEISNRNILLHEELGKTQNELRQEQAKTMELQMKIDYLCEKYDYKGEPL